MKTILFDSADLPGDERLRKECWVDTLSSGYVRLQADTTPDAPFTGQLRIAILGQTAVGQISGSVQTIARTATEIAAQNTDNAVLLVNAGSNQLLVGQKGKQVDCAMGSAVLIEQCEPSFIRLSPQDVCDFVAIQLPRQQLGLRDHDIENRFMKPVPASAPALALTRSYVDTLLRCADAEMTGVPRFASDHIVDLVLATAAPANAEWEQRYPDLRAVRLEMVQREIGRNFMAPDFSLTELARRLDVSPRYVQALLADAETSFTDEVTKRRLAQARDMLLSPRCIHMKILDIAYECGFPTIAHFHRIFRKHFGATPGEVRRRAATDRARRG
jgi:AraC-like DNA-binding protein